MSKVEIDHLYEYNRQDVLFTTKLQKAYLKDLAFRKKNVKAQKQFEKLNKPPLTQKLLNK